MLDEVGEITPNIREDSTLVDSYRNLNDKKITRKYEETTFTFLDKLLMRNENTYNRLDEYTIFKAIFGGNRCGILCESRFRGKFICRRY